MIPRIEYRLQAALVYDAANGTPEDRAILAVQIREAIGAITELRAQLADATTTGTIPTLDRKSIDWSN